MKYSQIKVWLKMFNRYQVSYIIRLFILLLFLTASQCKDLRSIIYDYFICSR